MCALNEWENIYWLFIQSCVRFSTAATTTKIYIMQSWWKLFVAMAKMPRIRNDDVDEEEEVKIPRKRYT